MALITINRDNFFHNLNQIALKVGSKDKIAVVLKDNAYGHGLEIMALLAQEYGIKQAVVKNLHEAREIRDKFTNILVLNDNIIKDSKLSFAINALSSIKKAQKNSRVELKVDTGMHRNGIALNELDEALKLIEKYKLKLVGVMTHFRSSDVLSSELFWQQKSFEYVKEKVKNRGFRDIKFHSYNSSAIFRSKEFSEDIVRAGIAIYGYNELPTCYDRVELKPVLSLYANRVSSRELKPSQRVGYGGDFSIDESIVISTYDIGYGDGLNRVDSQEPFIIDEGLAILGRVSMDFISLESRKERVLIIKDAQKSAKYFNTISYEILTQLSRDIKRVII